MQVNNPIDVSGVMSAAAADMKQISAAKVALDANTAAIQSSYDQTQSRYQQIGAAAALDTTVKGMGALQVQDAANRSGLELNVDPGDTMGRQRADAEELLQAQSDQSTALAEIKRKQSTSFFDDPLGWITNQFTINSDIDQYNTAEETAASATRNIQQRAAALDSNVKAFRLQQTTLSAASIQAQAEQAKNLALIQSDEAARQSLITNANNIKEQVSLSGQQLQAQATVLDSKVKQENIQIALEHLALSREEFEWKKLEKKHGEAANQYVVDTINRGLEVMDPNQPKLDSNSPRALALLSGKVPLDGLLKQAYDLGEVNRRLSPNGTQTRLLGTTPVQTLQTLAYKPALAPDQQAGVSLLTNAAAEAEKDPTYVQLKNAKDFAGANARMNELIKGVFKQQAVLVDGPTNIYHLPAAAEIIKQSPGLQELPFVQKVLAPLIKAGVPTTEPSQVYSAGLDAVKKGDITANQFAIDYAAIYKQGQRVNVASKQIMNLGIAPEEAYRTKINTGSFISDTVDNANAGEVLRSVSKSMARESLKDFTVLPFQAGQFVGSAMLGEDIPPNSGFPSYVPTRGKTK